MSTTSTTTTTTTTRDRGDRYGPHRMGPTMLYNRSLSVVSDYAHLQQALYAAAAVAAAAAAVAASDVMEDG